MEPDLGYKLTTFCRPFQFMTYRFHSHLFYASFLQKQAAFRWLMMWFNTSSWHMTNSSFSQCQRTSYRLPIPWHFILIFPIRTFILYIGIIHTPFCWHMLYESLLLSYFILFSSHSLLLFVDSFSVFLLCLYLPCSRMSNSFLFGTEVDWFDINNLIHSFWFSQGDSRHILHTYSPSVLHFWPVLCWRFD